MGVMGGGGMKAVVKFEKGKLKDGVYVIKGWELKKKGGKQALNHLISVGSCEASVKLGSGKLGGV